MVNEKLLQETYNSLTFTSTIVYYNKRPYKVKDILCKKIRIHKENTINFQKNLHPICVSFFI